jgi:hypothetical protein
MFPSYLPADDESPQKVALLTNMKVSQYEQITPPHLTACLRTFPLPTRVLAAQRSGITFVGDELTAAACPGKWDVGSAAWPHYTTQSSALRSHTA